MNSLIENNEITEMACGSNFAYIVADNSTFLSTEYKVLQSQANGSFVKCMKMMYNGKVQLYYLTQNLKSFASLLPVLDAESFLIIAANLLSDIINVTHIGFLSCQNIDISFDKIYVDPTTYKVSLVYLPLGKRMYDDRAAFENEIRTGLIKLISTVASLSSTKTMQLASDLSNGSLTLEDVYNRIKGGKNAAVPSIPQMMAKPANGVGQGILRIIAMNAPMRLVIDVTKDEFILGKKPGMADGVITFNKMISRSHCKINRHGNQYTVTDLQSANGTFINKVRLQPNQPYQVRNGDIIRLANSDFQVTIM